MSLQVVVALSHSRVTSKSRLLPLLFESDTHRVMCAGEASSAIHSLVQTRRGFTMCRMQNVIHTFYREAIDDVCHKYTMTWPHVLE